MCRKDARFAEGAGQRTGAQMWLGQRSGRLGASAQATRQSGNVQTGSNSESFCGTFCSPYNLAYRPTAITTDITLTSPITGAARSIKLEHYKLAEYAKIASTA